VFLLLHARVRFWGVGCMAAERQGHRAYILATTGQGACLSIYFLGLVPFLGQGFKKEAVRDRIKLAQEDRLLNRFYA